MVIHTETVSLIAEHDYNTGQDVVLIHFKILGITRKRVVPADHLSDFIGFVCGIKKEGRHA